jgi:tetratricopeptide (TPR) repeat protein
VIDGDRLFLAQMLSGRGNFAEAEAIYHEILSRRPDAIEAITGLGALAYHTGSVERASALFARGLALRPDLAELHANLGETLRMLRRNDEALAHLQQALALASHLPDAWNSLGLLLHDLRRYSEAHAAYREALRYRPDFNAALINLGMTLEAQGRIEEAVATIRMALARQPDNVAALANLAKLLIERDDPTLLGEAEMLCRKALAIAPNLGAAINNLGNVLKLQGRHDEAMACYQRAAALDPRGGRARWNIGQLLVQQGRYEEALRAFDEAHGASPDPEVYHLSVGGLWAMRHHYVTAAQHYRQAAELNPHLVEAHHGLGMALLEQGRLREAEASLNNALSIAPKRAGTLSALARIKREEGDLAASCQLARQALAANPNHADAYCELAITLRGKLTQTDIHEIRRIAGYPHTSEESRALLHFALASADDAAGRYREAADYCARANALCLTARKSRGVIYDPDRYSEMIDRLIGIFSPDFMAARKGWGDPDPRPVFVVGLPRTGSSLIEQILASHPKVHGAGEILCMQDLFGELPERVGLGPVDRCDAIAALTPDLAKTAAQRYLGLIESMSAPGVSRVVDKMLENITILGLIQLLLPAARVVICKRDPRDAALSCWQTPFATLPWASDVEHIARRIADCGRIADHWKRVITSDWIEIAYEDLVADLEGSARRLVGFVGLEWDPACLDFHATRRPVRTASSVQVREPVYQRSVGRWRDYDASLRPLWAALERHGVIGSDPERRAHDDRNMAR